MIRHGEDFRKRPVIRDERAEKEVFLRILLLSCQFLAPDAVRCFPLLLNLLLHAPDALQEFPRRKRLKQIVRHAKGNRLLSIDKFIIPGKNDDRCIRKFLPDQGRQLQTVHERHLNVRQENIRLCLQNHGPGKLPVARFADELDVFLLPVDLALDAVPHDDLIFYQE